MFQNPNNSFNNNQNSKNKMGNQNNQPNSNKRKKYYYNKKNNKIIKNNQENKNTQTDNNQEQQENQQQENQQQENQQQENQQQENQQQENQQQENQQQENQQQENQQQENQQQENQQQENQQQQDNYNDNRLINHNFRDYYRYNDYQMPYCFSPHRSFYYRNEPRILGYNIENSELSESIKKLLEGMFKTEEQKQKEDHIEKEVVPKEYKWIRFEINSLDDLIELSKEYGLKYSIEYSYNIDLELLSKMTNELEDLNKLIGLKKIKKQIVDLILYYALKLDNENHDLLHTVIEGEPGTGKTELAEKLAKIYLKLGILKNDVFKKVKRADLVAGYLGQTAIKTDKILEECKGGVLFIDEAYSLGNAEGKEGRDSFSKECIDTLNQALTENKNNFVCIIAGYKDDLAKSFFSYNNGLERRFPIRFSIESYSDEELSKIFIKKIKEYEWDIRCIKLVEIIKMNRKYFKFNGGDMEILFAKCKIAHCKNLLLIENKDKKVITDEDLEHGIVIYLENPNFKERGEPVKSYMSSLYI